MAVKQVGGTSEGNIRNYHGLTADAKPVVSSDGKPLGGGSTFYELDGKKNWVYSEVNINPATNNGWWDK